MKHLTPEDFRRRVMPVLGLGVTANLKKIVVFGHRRRGLGAPFHKLGWSFDSEFENFVASDCEGMLAVKLLAK